jgi:hypothetical protein
LVAAIPEKESIDEVVLRKGENISGQAKRGEEYLRRIFGADMDSFVATMNQYWPDLRKYSLDVI